MRSRHLAWLTSLWVSAALGAPSGQTVAEGRRLTQQAKGAYLDGEHARAAALYLSAWRRVKAPLLLKNALKILAVHLDDCGQIPTLTDTYLATGPTIQRAQEVAGYAAACLMRAALAHQGAGRWAEAEAALRRATRLPLEAARAGAVRAAAARLEAARALIKVRVEVRDAAGRRPAGAALRLDGRAVRAGVDESLRIRSGPHRLTVSAPGHQGASVDFEAEEGARLQIALRRTPAPAPAPVERALPRWAPWALAGLAAAAGVGAVAWDVRGQGALDELRAVGAAGRDRGRYDQLKGDARSARLWSSVLYGAAVVGGAGASALLLLGDEPGAASPAQGPGAGRGGAR